MKKLITKNECLPTHRLILRDGDVEKKILLTPDQVEKVFKDINSSSQFIIFEKTKEIYPKMGLRLKKLTENELNKLFNPNCI